MCIIIRSKDHIIIIEEHILPAFFPALFELLLHVDDFGGNVIPNEDGVVLDQSHHLLVVGTQYVVQTLLHRVVLLLLLLLTNLSLLLLSPITNITVPKLVILPAWGHLLI